MNPHRAWLLRKPLSGDFITVLLIACFTLPYYAYQMARGVGTLFMTTGAGMTFNSQLAHLLAGKFDVDPEAVSAEGFAIDGKTYTYLGILPALLRLPLLAVLDLSTVDVTGLMCVIASWIGGLVRVVTILMIRRATPTSPTQTLGVSALLLSVVLGGAQIQFLRPSIFQESCYWGSVLATIFVYLSMRGCIVHKTFSGTLLVKMAFIAGLALMTRVTFGIGLYSALILLVLFRAWQDTSPLSNRWIGTFYKLLTRETLPTILVLGFFVILCGIVNTMRWGKPWIFLPFDLYLMNDYYPDRVIRLHQYGEFNLLRFPFGAGYYFFPLWSIVGANGRFMFSQWQDRLFDSYELPPATFFLTDPLLTLFFGVFLIYARKLHNRNFVIPLLVGLSVPPMLLMVAINLAFRYRLEFYPVLELGAYFGFILLCQRDRPPMTGPILRRSILGYCLLGIFVSQMTLLCYRASPAGVPAQLLEGGLLGPNLFTYYRSAIGF